jgi:rare lipoprotein A
MRKLLMTFAFVSTTAVFAATSANAAARWACEGADYVCGSKSAAAPSYDASERKSVRAKSTEKAERAPRAQRTAKRDNDDKPARSRARASRNDDGNSGGGASYSGQASYYWQPQALASGGRFNPNAMTAAHKTLPFGTRVRVTNQRNGQSVDVVINDRGPYVGGRIIDLSKAAAGAINMQGAGVAPVTVKVLGRG